MDSLWKEGFHCLFYRALILFNVTSMLYILGKKFQYFWICSCFNLRLPIKGKSLKSHTSVCFDLKFKKKYCNSFDFVYSPKINIWLIKVEENLFLFTVTAHVLCWFQFCQPNSCTFPPGALWPAVYPEILEDLLKAFMDFHMDRCPWIKQSCLLKNVIRRIPYLAP